MDEARHGLAKGYTIEGYRIEKLLGAGGFGITYLATEVAINRLVAIKEYLPNGIAARARDDVSVQPLTSGDMENFQWGLDRFRREAQTLVAFHHPNIVSVYRYFEQNGTAYLVMGYEDGDSLSAVLDKRKTLPEPEIRAILIPLFSGLEHVHKAGFLHRDIKPGNIYIRKDGSPVLLDFGAARLAVGARSQSLTSIVSAGYAPFEQYTTRGNQGPWTDIYALGGVLYRAVTGQRPPDAPDRIRKDPLVPTAKAARGKYTPGLLAAIDAALIVDEEKRPQGLSQWRLVFDGAPWPPRDENAPTAPPPVRAPHSAVEGGTLVAGPVRSVPAREIAPDATLAVGADAASTSKRDDDTRWPERQATMAPTRPPVARAGGGGLTKWVLIGGLATVCLAGIGVGAYLLIPGSKPGVTTSDPPSRTETPAQAADRRVGTLLGEARAAIERSDFPGAERALAEADALVQQHALAARRSEIAGLRADIERKKAGTTTLSGSWPAHPELRRAVDETIQRIAR